MLAFGRGSAAAIAASAPRGAGLVAVASRTHFGKPHAVLGERAGLVGAHHVDAGEPLDGGQLLHQALRCAEPDHADREGDRRQQHQPLRHHRDQRGDHPGQRPRERFAR